MKRWCVLLLAVLAAPARSDDEPFTRTRDVIYGRKFGLAMTMDVCTPKTANGRGVIFVVSGGWFSDTRGIQPMFIRPLTDRGYTVFAVVHGSQPKFTIPEILEDMHRAVRFVRANAATYKVDPDRLGIYGASAGGHLSLMMGCAGGPGDPKAPDPVDRLSSRVQAVACFFPPTDFLNFGAPGKEMIDRALQPPFTAAVDYHEFDKARARFFPITDKARLREITKQVSPITHVSRESAPTLLIHGDRDKLVPVQQSELILAKFKEVDVAAELVVKKGAGHSWPNLPGDLTKFADWFDRHLLTDAKK